MTLLVYISVNYSDIQFMRVVLPPGINHIHILYMHTYNTCTGNMCM